MKLASFDPGKVSSYAVFDTREPWRIEVGEVDLSGIGRFLRPCPRHIGRIIDGVDQVLVEEVGSMTRQGVSSMFTFGLAVGALLNAISCHGYPVEMVKPQQWKVSSRLGGLKDTEAKRAACRYARELWPAQAGLFEHSTKHGRAEAALMARWYFLKGPGKDIELDGDSPMRAPAGTA